MKIQLKTFLAALLFACASLHAGRAVFPGYDAEVISWNTRCNTNSGTTLPSTRLAATALLRDIRVANLRSSIYRLNPMAGNPAIAIDTTPVGTRAAQVPLIIDKGFTLDLFTGSTAAPTYTEQGQNAGLRANQAATDTQRYDTGFLATNDIANYNSFHLLAYVTASTNEAGMVMGAQGPIGNTNSLYFMPAWVDGKFYCAQYNELQYAVDNAGSNGCFIGTRTAATTLITYTNGFPCATNSNGAGQPTTNTMTLFGRHIITGSADNISTKTMAGYEFGTGLTAAQAITMNDAWQRFERALYRNK